MSLLRTLATLLLFISFSSFSQSNDVIDGQFFVQLDAAFNHDISWERNETVIADPILDKFIDKYYVTKILCPFKLNVAELKGIYIFKFENIDRTSDFIHDLFPLSTN